MAKAASIPPAKAAKSPEKNKNMYERLAKSVSLTSLMVLEKVMFFLSGGSIRLGICRWVPTLVTMMPIKISMAATRPYSDQASGLNRPSENFSVTFEGPNQNQTRL